MRDPASTRPLRYLVRCTVAALTAALAGCGVPASELSEPPAMPAAFAATQGGRVGELSSDWVRGFRSAELAELTAAADRDNLDLAAALARIAQAEATLAGRRAAMAPSVAASGQAQRAVSPSTRSRFDPPFPASVGDDYTLGLSAAWTLDLNGRLAALTRSQAATARAAAIEHAATRLTTSTAVVNAWLTVGAARERIRIARESVATAEHTLGVYRRRKEVGTATALDLAQQESLVASQRATIPDLEITERQTLNALAVLLGRAPEGFDVRIASVSGVVLPRIGAGVPSRLLDRRPDVAAAEAQLSAAAANVTAARAAFLPSVSLTGSTGLASAFLKNLLRPDAIASSAAASVAETVFDAGARQADLDAAEGRRAELVATYRKTALVALADVENALVAIEQNRRHEQLQQAVVTAARRAQTLTEERLSEGTIDITTVLEAERTLFQAEQTLVGVRLARLQAVVDLVGALGGGWAAAPATDERGESR